MKGKIQWLATVFGLVLGGAIAFSNLPTAQAQLPVQPAVVTTGQVAVTPVNWWNGYRWGYYRPYWYGSYWYGPRYNSYYAPYYYPYPRYSSYYCPGSTYFAYRYPAYRGWYYW
jgi:hypothetical protein